jgi:hypothetical protein
LTTSSCKSVLLLLAGAAFMLTGCAATGDRWETLAPVQWAGTDQQGSGQGISWASESVRGQWAGLKVAVLPVHNMTAVPGPLKDLEQLFYVALKKGGVRVLEEEILNQFMAERRMRYTGGVDRITASAMKDETGVEAVFVSSLEYYDEGDPPKISLHARLVSLGKDLEIQWMDSYCGAGDDSPGFLDLGLIEDPRRLLEKAVDQLARSMMLHLAGESARNAGADPGRHSLPTDTYRSPSMESAEPATVAVMPFLNLSERSYAWEILPLHFVRRMARLPGVRILEPGEVRRALLNSRVFLQGGLSRPHLELALLSTGADLVLTGTVMRYLDTRVAFRDPEVEFSVEVFDRAGKEIVWSSYSDGKGGDGVFFFGVGRRSTACSLADTMVSATISGMSLQAGDPETTSSTEGVIP